MDSAEYHSQLEDNREEEVVEEEEEEEEGEEMAMATANKKGSKKKRYFGIFRKNKSKDKRKNKLTPTADLMHTLSVPGETSHPSSVRRTFSSLSTCSEWSMEHVETQEFAETLMNPTPRNSLIGKDSRVGGNVGLRLLTGG